jgi:regulator of replication initiation timing
MNIHPVTILEFVDRVVEATPEPDVKTTWEGFRRTFRGAVSDVILQHLVIPGEDGDRVESLEQRIEGLKQQVSDLVAEKTELETQIAELQERLRQITHLPGGPSDEGFYTMEQFLAVLTVKLRRSYGWRTDYVCASQQTEGCRPVANETVQKWQNTGKVPDWAVDQIDKLNYRKRAGRIGAVPWSDENENYLADRYRDNPNQSNQELAHLCEEHFGRPINVPSVKGAIDRLRKKDKLPSKRPPRAKI